MNNLKNLTPILLRTFQQPHCYTSVASQLQEAEGFNYTLGQINEFLNSRINEL